MPNPELLRPKIDPQNPGVIVITCSDSRLQKSPIIQQPPGKVFRKHNIAGAVQPHTDSDRDLDAFLEFSLTALNGIHTIVIQGHTDCGGMKGLADILLRDTSRKNSSLAEWLKPLSSKTLEHMVAEAYRNGVSKQAVANSLERLMPLLSARRLLERMIKHDGHFVTVGDLLEEKQIRIVPALFDIATNKTEIFNLETGVYEETQNFNCEPRTKDLTPFKPGPRVSLGKKSLVQELDWVIHKQLLNLWSGSEKDR